MWRPRHLAAAFDGREAPHEVDVAIYLPSLGEGGIERVYLNLAQELVRRTLRVDLLVAQLDGARSAEVPPGARVVDLAAPSRRTLSLFPGLVRYLRSTQPAALLACSNLNLVALWTRIFSHPTTRIIITIHNHLSTQFANLPVRHRWVLRPVMALSYSRADAIVAVSAQVADDLSRFLGLERTRIDVIYNPVLTDAALQTKDEPIEHPWFAEAQPPVILGAGRLIARKDYATLLRAFALVRQQRAARLVIVGEGEERPHLERLVHKLGCESDVSLPGFVAKPFPYFSRAKLFVLSSRWEGLPTNVVEAMACGCPVVATDCPGGGREILEGGRLGRLVPVGDAESMAEAMIMTLDEPRLSDRLSSRAMDFHVDRIVDQYLRILHCEQE